MYDWQNLNRLEILAWVQHMVSGVGILIIASGVVIALYQFIVYLFRLKLNVADKINIIRLELSRCLILGLEFIIAADLIATTTTPDYYSLGILAVIVIIRSVLSYSLNREISTLSSPAKE